MTRSVPLRENTIDWIAISSGVPRRRRPPMPAYSPSVFSRTQTMSISAAPLPARGLATPGSRRIGRRLTYWSKPWRSGSSSPQRLMWSATRGSPTGPSRTAAKTAPLETGKPVLGHHRPVCQVVLRAPVEMLIREAQPTHLLCDGVERHQRLGHDLPADAVAGDDSQMVLA